MNMEDLVSIIMPSYNTAKYISKTIESVLKQTYKNWELIIVDDCSTDNFADVISNINDSRIRVYYNEKNSGAAISRNKALREAKGKWIAFLDSDDLWDEDKLRKQIDFMASNNYDFSYTKYIEIDEEDNSTSLFLKMAEAAKKLILTKLPEYIDGNLKGEEQDPALVTFCPTIKPEQEKLDLNKDVKEINGWIRGLSDHPGAYFLLEDKKLKVFKAKIINEIENRPVGEIIQADKNGLVVQLKGGQLSLLIIQKEGKNKMDYKSFLNGNQGLLGKRLD